MYVDDILLIRSDVPELQSVKAWLGKCFAMKDLGEAAYILGIRIYRDRSRRLIGLSQSTYVDKILKRFNMENSKKGNVPIHCHTPILGGIDQGMIYCSKSHGNYIIIGLDSIKY